MRWGNKPSTNLAQYGTSFAINFDKEMNIIIHVINLFIPSEYFVKVVMQ